MPCHVPMITIDLTNKTAIVTGGGQGLGKATATALHAAGANVVVSFFDDAAGINRARAEETAQGLSPRALALEGDVRCRDSLTRLLDQVTGQFGEIDILINNAGILRDRTLSKMSDDDWQAVIDTNLTGVFRMCQLAGSRLADGGRIVNMASISGTVGFFGQTNYAAAKAGVVGLTKVVSKELASRRITVNAVAPGVVLTDMGQSIPQSARDVMLQQIPLRRFGQPEEIANVVLFLCSPLADYMTGQTLHVNGGWVG